MECANASPSTCVTKKPLSFLSFRVWWCLLACNNLEETKKDEIEMIWCRSVQALTKQKTKLASFLVQQRWGCVA